MNAITYKEIFPLIKENRMWPGANEKGGTRKGNTLLFSVSDDYTGASVITDKDNKRFAQVSAWWFTNLDIKKRHEPLILYKRYKGHEDEYPRYDNYDAINVDKTTDIPEDYDGVMGVPISFLDKYCPEQFEIVGATESEGKGFSMGLWDKDYKVTQPLVKWRKIYKRLFVKRRM